MLGFVRPPFYGPKNPRFTDQKRCLERCVVKRIVVEFAKMSCVVKRIIVEFAKIDVFTDWRVVRRMQFDVVQNFLHNILQFQNFCVFKQIIVKFAKN